MIELLLLASMAAQQGPVVINEFSYDDSSTDDFEFVELYNTTSNPIDISGWSIQGEDQNGLNLGWTINSGTVIAPGGFFVAGAPTIANVNQVLVDPSSGLSTNLFQNGPHDAIYILDGSGNLVDRVDYETYNSGWTPADMEGGGLPGACVAAGLGLLSYQRYFDGYDNNDNGCDFRMSPRTPGATNNLGNRMPYIDGFDGQPIGNPIPAFSPSFVEGQIIDPTRLAGTNPLAIPASPQGGEASIWYDPTGGGDCNTLITDPIRDIILECYVYIESAPPSNSTDGESWSVGIRGSSDGFGHHPFIDPQFATITGVSTATWKTGNTGLSFTYQRTQQYVKCWFVDWGCGGDGFNVLAEFVIQPGVNDGWQRIKMRAIGDRCECNFGGTFGQNDGTQVSGKLQSTAPGIVYLSYREFLVNNPDWRPLTIDNLWILPGSGEVRFSGQSTPTSQGTPDIDVTGLAFQGNQNFGVVGSTLIPNSSAFLLTGFQLLPNPIDLGALGGQNGSFIYVDSVVTSSGATNGTGEGTFSLPVPTTGALVGAPLEFQILQIDGGINANLPIANTRVVGITVGN